MKKIDTDIAVIGAGTAGLAAYRAAKAGGKRAVIIEGGPYGTTCARVGCMPSKLLIAAADAAHEAQNTTPFGVHIDGTVRIDSHEVMARVQRERDRFVDFVVSGIENIPEEDRIVGYARFRDQTTLAVGEEIVVKATRVVIATGSTAKVPTAFRELGDRVVINDDVFAWNALPQSVAVFGPGIIGLELGQALSRLGVRVKVFGRGRRVGPLTDPVIRDYAKTTFRDQIPLDADADVRSVARDGDEVVISYVGADGIQANERFEYLLATTGREPNVGRLGLENTGLELDEHGVPLFDECTLQCGDSPIFLAGDVNNVLPLLHEAADDGRTAGENAVRFPDTRRGHRRARLVVVFTDPQMAMVGQRFADLAPGSFVTGEVSFEEQGRSRIMRKNTGLMHVYAEVGSGRFLGAEWLGPRAENIAHLLAWAAQKKLTVAEMLDMPFYHPVVEEGVRTALRDAAAQLENR